MACPTVSKFLFCVTLETGGLIIGWLTVLYSLLFMAYMGIALAVSVALYNNFTPTFPNEQNIALGVFIFLVFVFSIALIYYTILLVASVLLIRGTRTRDHTKLMLFMVLMCIGIVIYILQILVSGVGGIVIAVIMLVIVIYFYLCIYSLYNKLRNDKMNPPQMQPYTQTVVYAAPYQAQPNQYAQATPQVAVYPAAQSTSDDQPKPSAPV